MVACARAIWTRDSNFYFISTACFVVATAIVCFRLIVHTYTSSRGLLLDVSCNFLRMSRLVYVERNCGTVLRNAAETRSGKYCIPFVVPLVSFVLFLPCFLTVVPPFWVKCYSRYVVCLFTEPPRTAQQVFNFSCPAKLMSLFSFRSEQWRNQRKESLTCCDFCSSWSQDHLVGTIPMLVPVSLFFFFFSFSKICKSYDPHQIDYILFSALYKVPASSSHFPDETKTLYVRACCWACLLTSSVSCRVLPSYMFVGWKCGPLPHLF